MCLLLLVIADLLFLVVADNLLVVMADLLFPVDVVEEIVVMTDLVFAVVGDDGRREFEKVDAQVSFCISDYALL